MALKLLIWQRILITLNTEHIKNMLDLSRKIPTTYKMISDNIKKLEKEGMIKTEKKGRSRKITLTKKGRRTFQYMNIGGKK